MIKKMLKMQKGIKEAIGHDMLVFVFPKNRLEKNCY